MIKAFKIPQAFLGFLVASLLFWFLMNLSKEYTSEVTFSVAYKNLEQDKLIINEPQKEINLQIKGNGFKLIGANFMRKPLILDLKKLHKKSDSLYYLLSKGFIPDIQKQLKSGITLENALQDSLFFKINKLHSKKVAIYPNLNITYKKGFDIASPIELSPDSITISGAESDLKSIHNVLTDKVELLNVDQNISQKIQIQIPPKTKAKYTTTQLSLNVDKFTEGQIEIPINIINLPNEGNINVYPKKVTVIYKVGLKNFNQITSNSFEALCDFKESEQTNLPYLVPKLNIKTNLISSVRVVPNKIDFLIHK